MNLTQLLLVLLVVLLAILITALVRRLGGSGLFKRLPVARPPEKPQPTTAAPTTQEDEDKVIEMAQTDSPGTYAPVTDVKPEKPRSRRLRPLLLSLAIVLLLIPVGALLFGNWWNATDPEAFVVLVAPFRDLDGAQVSDTGRAVASALVQELRRQSNGSIVARQLDEAPADATAANQVLANQSADLLIWGEVRPGDLLDSQSLRPLVAYRPTGSFAPAAWDGYIGRFMPPPATELSAVPINGKVILPALAVSLASYAQGDVDTAYNRLGQLLADYPMLRPALLSSVRGNILWASGQYGPAIDEYRRALVGATIEQPYLLNDLAAVSQDAGDPQQADATLAQARQLPGADAIPAITVNLANSAMLRGDLSGALSLINTLPAGEQRPLAALLTQAAAERANGNYQVAETALATAKRRIALDSALAPGDLGSMLKQRLHGVLQEQQMLAELAQLIDGKTGKLEWELEYAESLDSSAVSSLANQMTSVRSVTEDLVQSWRNISTAADAASNPVRGQVAEGQSLHLEGALARQRYLEALLLIEQRRASGPPRQQTFLTSLWEGFFGSSTPASRAAALLRSEIERGQESTDLQFQLGRALRLQGNSQQASAAYVRASELDPARPEPFYGQAQLSLDAGDRATASTLLSEAINRDPNYFVARKSLAEIAVADNNWAAAAEQQRWLAQNRPSPLNDLALARSLRRMGPPSYAEAEKLLLRWVEVNDRDSLLAFGRDAQIELGRLYRDAGKLDAAETWFARAANTAPASAEAAYEYGTLLAQQQRWAEAEQQFQNALSYDGGRVDARIGLAGLYSGPLNKPDQAVEQYGVLLDDNITNPEQLEQAGDAMLQFGQPSDAYDAYTRALQQRPDEPQLHLKLARAALAMNRLTDARDHADKAISGSGGTLAPAIAMLGEIERESGKPAEARDRFNEALSIDPNLPDAYIGMGRAIADEGNWSVALDYFQRAVAANPSDPRAHFWLAEAYLRQPIPQLNDALASYKSCLDLQGLDAMPEAIFGMAQANLALGKDAEAAGLADEATRRTDEALSWLDQALAKRPGYAEALLLRGKIFQERGRTDDALADYNRSISSNDDITETYYRRALLVMQQGDYLQAQRDLQRAINLQDNFPEAHYWLGRTYFIEGDFRSALAAFDRALVLRPDFGEAQSYRDQAQQRLDAQTTASQ